MPVCPVALTLALCLSVPEIGTNQPQVDIRYPAWQLREMHEHYRRDRAIWNIEKKLGPFSMGMALGDTKDRNRRFFGREKTIYLYSEYEHVSFLATPKTISVTFKWEFK